VSVVVSREIFVVPAPLSTTGAVATSELPSLIPVHPGLYWNARLVPSGDQSG